MQTAQLRLGTTFWWKLQTCIHLSSKVKSLIGSLYKIFLFIFIVQIIRLLPHFGVQRGYSPVINSCEAEHVAPSSVPKRILLGHSSPDQAQTRLTGGSRCTIHPF